MRKIRLYGVLAKKFGKEFELDVKSPAEAIRALCAIVPGFKRHMVEHSEPGYTIRVGKEYRDASSLAHPSSTREAIKIAPALAGSNSTARIIIGIILIVGSFFIDPTGATGAKIATAMFSVGVGMTLSGIAELLVPTPKMKAKERPENEPSYAFDGPVNTIGQGHAVPVGYGRLTVGSQVISAQLLAENLHVAPVSSGGGKISEMIVRIGAGERGYAAGSSSPA